jgi:hypothetical protein
MGDKYGLLLFFVAALFAVTVAKAIVYNAPTLGPKLF